MDLEDRLHLAHEVQTRASAPGMAQHLTLEPDTAGTWRHDVQNHTSAAALPRSTADDGEDLGLVVGEIVKLRRPLRGRGGVHQSAAAIDTGLTSSVRAAFTGCAA